MDLVHVLLVLHVLGAIIAFGPSFSFPVIGALGAKEPMHGNFALRVSLAITDKRVEPLAVLQGITGLGLLFSVPGLDLWKSTWLLIAIPIYVVALAFAFMVQRKNLRRAIELTSTPPPPGAPAGPPPELARLLASISRGGTFLGIAIIVIVILMVTKPVL